MIKLLIFPLTFLLASSALAIESYPEYQEIIEQLNQANQLSNQMIVLPNCQNADEQLAIRFEVLKDTFANTTDNVSTDLLKSKQWQCSLITSTGNSEYFQRNCPTNFRGENEQIEMTMIDYGGSIDYSYNLKQNSNQISGVDNHWYRQNSQISIHRSDDSKSLYIEQKFNAVGPGKITYARCF